MTQASLETALQHHQAGRLGEAEALYREILAANPDDADALQLLGLLCLHRGEALGAVELIERAVRLDGQAPDYHCNLGIALAALGRHEEAVGAFQRAIALRPRYPEAHNALGASLYALGRFAQAAGAYRELVKLQPGFAPGYTGLGAALAADDQWDQAIAAFRQRVGLLPGDAQGWNNLGKALKENSQFDEAVTAYRQAIALRPDYPEAHNDLILALVASVRIEEAVAAAQNLLAMRPDWAPTYLALATAYVASGQLEEAESACRKAVALRPDDPAAHYQLGVALHGLCRLDEAAAAHRQALRLKPDLAAAHMDLGLLEVLRGNWREGWREYEWRWKIHRLVLPNPRFTQTMWDGADPAGRRILVHTEAGYGDSIQIARFVPEVARRGGRVILRCQEKLRRLFASLPDVEQLFSSDQPLPEFDVHCPLLSVPRALEATLETVPASVPYLFADPALGQRWQQRLAADPADGALKVGLVWAGNPRPYRDRSIPLAQFCALGQIPGVRFYSLQTGPSAQEARSLPAGFQVTDWSAELNDFADTAALLDQLDLLITVDTAVAHLGGALGKPTWVLLRMAGDWHWPLHGASTPWYPAIRLFRQVHRGDWSGPMDQVAAELRTFAAR